MSRSSDTNRAAVAIEEVDLAIAHGAGAWRGHSLVKAMGTISELADQPQLYTLCWGTMIAGVLRKDRRMARAGARMLAAQWLATRAKSAIKHRIDRTRPHVPVEGGEYHMEKGDSRDHALSSFPSGHTAGATAVARAFASEYPEHATAAGGAAAFVALVQLPRCKHFVSDLGAGAAIGLAAGSLVAARSTPPSSPPAMSGSASVPHRSRRDDDAAHGTAPPSG